MDSVKCLDIYVCGKASGQEEIIEHSIGYFSPVVCVKPYETSRGISVGAIMAVIRILQNIKITFIRAVTCLMQHQLREGTSKNAMDI